MVWAMYEHTSGYICAQIKSYIEKILANHGCLDPNKEKSITIEMIHPQAMKELEKN